MKHLVLTSSRFLLIASLLGASACSGMGGGSQHAMWDKAFAQSMVPAKPASAVQ